MPLSHLELERANAKCADLQRRLHAGTAPNAAELQRELATLADVVGSVLHVLDRSLKDRKQANRPV